jgi:hypothetical protein
MLTRSGSGAGWGIPFHYMDSRPEKRLREAARVRGLTGRTLPGRWSLPWVSNAVTMVRGCPYLGLRVESLKVDNPFPRGRDYYFQCFAPNSQPCRSILSASTRHAAA